MLNKTILKNIDKLKEIIGSNTITALGIDQGYANLGYSVIEFNLDTLKYSIIESGTYKTKSTLPLNERLKNIYIKIEEVLKDKNVKIAGCERLFHNNPMGNSSGGLRNKSASIMRTNMASGVIYLLTAYYNILIEDYPPSTVKKQVTGNGRATKDDVIAVVQELANEFDMEVKTEHQADSIAIGITTINKYFESLLAIEEVEEEPVKKVKKTRKKSTSKKKGAMISNG